MNMNKEFLAFRDLAVGAVFRWASPPYFGGQVIDFPCVKTDAAGFAHNGDAGLGATWLLSAEEQLGDVVQLEAAPPALGDAERRARIHAALDALLNLEQAFPQGAPDEVRACRDRLWREYGTPAPTGGKYPDGACLGADSRALERRAGRMTAGARMRFGDLDVGTLFRWVRPPAFVGEDTSGTLVKTSDLGTGSYREDPRDVVETWRMTAAELQAEVTVVRQAQPKRMFRRQYLVTVEGEWFRFSPHVAAGTQEMELSALTDAAKPLGEECVKFWQTDARVKVHVNPFPFVPPSDKPPGNKYPEDPPAPMLLHEARAAQATTDGATLGRWRGGQAA